jgi:hypothetical protein
MCFYIWTGFSAAIVAKKPLSPQPLFNHSDRPESSCRYLAAPQSELRNAPKLDTDEQKRGTLFPVADFKRRFQKLSEAPQTGGYSHGLVDWQQPAASSA